jgi:imidazole glycerol-phosphate synthase subunit HisH
VTGDHVGVIDHGVANLGSVLNMLKRIDVPARRVSSPEDLMASPRLLLPGVGAFDRGMAGIRSRGLEEAVHAAASRGTPLLGICLGMQLLGRSSEEGSSPGLGLLDADCRRIQGGPDLRVPQMGWNWLSWVDEESFLARADDRPKYYFAHSFHMVPDDPAIVLAHTSYGSELTAVVAHENVMGAQFHPEKSHVHGMKFLRAFAEWTP